MFFARHSPGWGGMWEDVHVATRRLDGDFWRRLREEAL